MKILITGSQGFLGKSLAYYAVRNGHHVLGVSRSEANGLTAGMEFIRCGLDQAGFVDVLNGFASTATRRFSDGS
jgi:nucleoside-diphosphate-sugar epimerase